MLWKNIVVKVNFMFGLKGFYRGIGMGLISKLSCKYRIKIYELTIL